MAKINRRKFIYSGAVSLTGLAALSATGIVSQGFAPVNAMVDQVKLGQTGLTVSRVAMGTGSIGGNHQSNQTRLGLTNFVKMAHHAYERGIHFFDTADTYGSYPFIKEVLKDIPREKVTLLGKMWTYDDVAKSEPVDKALDRFRLEAGTDYFDIMLLHCMSNGNWKEEKKRYIEYFMTIIVSNLLEENVKCRLDSKNMDQNIYLIWNITMSRTMTIILLCH